MLGEKLKSLREAKGLVQRQIAAELQVDTAYISKMQNNEKPVSRGYLAKLAILLGIPEQELLTIWLADKFYELAKNEEVGLKAMQVAEHELRANQKGSRQQ